MTAIVYGSGTAREAQAMTVDVGYRSPLLSPIKWPGGKRLLVPRLAELWTGHEHRRLVEPFAGSCSVALGLMPEKALLNDIALGWQAFWQNVRRGFTIPPSVELKHNKRTYYRARKRFNEIAALSSFVNREVAGLFYYLNHTGFNGVFRVGPNGFNVPMGKTSSGKRVQYRCGFEEYVAPLQNWVFSSRDFTELTVERNDFLYCDPPYDDSFAGYTRKGFGWEDQVTLAHWASRRECPTVVSNAATKRVVELYRDHGFQIYKLNARRSISCNGDRGKEKEILAVRNLKTPWKNAAI